MDYFTYNRRRAQDQQGTEEPKELKFTGDETIEVEEDHSVTVDDIREFIRNMHDDAKQPSNVVRIRDRTKRGRGVAAAPPGVATLIV